VTGTVVTIAVLEVASPPIDAGIDVIIDKWVVLDRFGLYSLACIISEKIGLKLYTDALPKYQSEITRNTCDKIIGQFWKAALTTDQFLYHVPPTQPNATGDEN
jgi:hypothetical protein